MNSPSDDARRQARAIQEQMRPQKNTETPREARYRVQREREQAEKRKYPHRQY